MEPLSLVVITYNEESNIGRCIQSVPFAAEVIVLDSGSTDKTVQIAKHLGARVLVESWRGYFKQKVRATAVARHSWVLSLDADEALSPELAKEIEALMKSSSLHEAEAYQMPRVANYWGKWIKSGGWYPDLQTRVFNKTKVEWMETLPHETLNTKLIKKLNGEIQHYAYRDVSHHISSINKKTTYLALQMFEKKQNPGPPSFVQLVKDIFISYYLKKARQDGLAGLMVSVTTAFSQFLVRAKYKELSIIQSKK